MSNGNRNAGAIRAAFFLAFVWPLGVGSVATAQEIESRIARGGMLYDDWRTIAEGEAPQGTHPSYPKAGKKVGKATWRCKECHGWDYKGASGHYGKGDSFTGIKGIRAFDGADPAAVRAILRDKTHALSEFMLKPADIEDLALFVARGQIDMDKHVDPESRKAKGNAARGAAYYNTICAKCHGMDGRLPRELAESIGKLSRRAPWEVLHKVRNGEPGKEMPALRAIPSAEDVAGDILAYTQTLAD